jgi:hypothetical protein
MGVEQLYFIIGFLLGVLLVGSIAVAILILYHEWLRDQEKN